MLSNGGTVEDPSSLSILSRLKRPRQDLRSAANTERPSTFIHEGAIESREVSVFRAKLRYPRFTHYESRFPGRVTAF